MASLLVISGTGAGDYYLLGRQAIEIGRDEDCPIQIVDEAVSRRHVRIARGGGGGAQAYHAEDLGSANGTWLNDVRIDAPQRLADGDLLRVGGTELMFSAVDFADGETAFQHHRRRGEREKGTIVRKK